MKLIIASNNAHKLTEIKAILGGMFDEILSLREAGIEHETIEDGSSFMENAEKKARDGDDKANNRLLLEKLETAETRAAHYTCAIALVRPDGSCVRAEGHMQGVIAHEEAGENGFGYDPLFFLPQYGLTAAQISPEEKNRISHRAQALHQLLAELGK